MRRSKHVFYMCSYKNFQFGEKGKGNIQGKSRSNMGRDFEGVNLEGDGNRTGNNEIGNNGGSNRERFHSYSYQNQYDHPYNQNKNKQTPKKTPRTNHIRYETQNIHAHPHQPTHQQPLEQHEPDSPTLPKSININNTFNGKFIDRLKVIDKFKNKYKYKNVNVHVQRDDVQRASDSRIDDLRNPNVTVYNNNNKNRNTYYNSYDRLIDKSKQDRHSVYANNLRIRMNQFAETVNERQRARTRARMNDTSRNRNDGEERQRQRQGQMGVEEDRQGRLNSRSLQLPINKTNNITKNIDNQNNLNINKSPPKKIPKFHTTSTQTFDNTSNSNMNSPKPAFPIPSTTKANHNTNIKQRNSSRNRTTIIQREVNTSRNVQRENERNFKTRVSPDLEIKMNVDESRAGNQRVDAGGNVNEKRKIQLSINSNINKFMTNNQNNCNVTSNSNKTGTNPNKTHTNLNLTLNTPNNLTTYPTTTATHNLTPQPHHQIQTRQRQVSFVSKKSTNSKNTHKYFKAVNTEQFQYTQTMRRLQQFFDEQKFINRLLMFSREVGTKTGNFGTGSKVINRGSYYSNDSQLSSPNNPSNNSIAGTNTSSIRVYRQDIHKIIVNRYTKDRLTIFLDTEYIEDHRSIMTTMNQLINLKKLQVQVLAFLIMDQNRDGFITPDDLLSLMGAKRQRQKQNKIISNFNQLIMQDIFKIIEYLENYKKYNNLINNNKIVQVIDLQTKIILKDEKLTFMKYRINHIKQKKKKQRQNDQGSNSNLNNNVNINSNHMRQYLFSFKQQNQQKQRQRDKGGALERLEQDTTLRAVFLAAMHNSKNIANKKSKNNGEQILFESKQNFCINFDRFCQIFNYQVPKLFIDFLYVLGGLELPNQKYLAIDTSVLAPPIVEEKIQKQEEDKMELVRRRLENMSILSRELEIQKMKNQF